LFRFKAGPGGALPAGAGILSMIHLPVALSLQDSASAARIPPADSLAGRPVPVDHVTPIIQFFFQKAPWVMWGGVVLGLLVAFVILRWLWPRRQQILPWLHSRSSAVKAGMVAAVLGALAIAASAGYTGYHFVETDKRFCNGCHIFVPGGEHWALPDSGDYTLVPRMEGKHDTVSCHTCHPLKPFKEAVKMVFWMSGVRDERIPEHARVPRRTCENCHVQGAAKKTWQAIATTAGHRAHLESDSSALKGKVECLTCHARTAHRFMPADSTCVQQGCHLTGETKIQLGKMAGQTDLHCTVCHKFAQPVALLATRDSAAGALRPGLKQCLSCHKMELLVPNFSAGKDPHSGTCGMCHNPHTQTNKGETRKSCAEAGCHADWRGVPFHAGQAHRKQAEQCVLCHQPHEARVDASDCVGCHESVRSRNPGGRLRPPLPFDTLKVLRQSMAPVPAPVEPEERPSKVKGDAPPGDDPPWRPPTTLSVQPSDTFPHPRHKKLACLTCHLSKSGATLTFEPPRGCQICHHQTPATSDCAKCHEKGSLPDTVEVRFSVAAAGKAARERTVGFRHERHKDLRCTDCHGKAVSLEPVDSAATCKGCHAKHHESGRTCAVCHRTPTITEVHAAPARVHVACDACHPTAAIAELTPTRSLCLACHDPKVDHHAERECSTCHLQAHPDDYRTRLLKHGTAG
jgi:hypothetical protein